MAAIESVYAREILDSRGNPTVQVYLETEDGAQGIGLVPSGASLVKQKLGNVAMATSPVIKARARWKLLRLSTR